MVHYISTGDMEVDGMLVGERSLLEAVGTGGISTEGLVESRSVTTGGFKFPDGSIQTTAMDASCPAGSSIRSISPDGTVVCETDDSGGGTVTSITAGSGLSGGTITTTGTILVASGGINESMIAGNAVTSAKIADNAVDTAAVVNGAITAAKVNSNEVQRRIAGSCGAGQFVIAVNTDGTLVCAAIYDFLSIPPVISTLDDTENTLGLSTSIAIGTDGLPVISYHDGTAGALKVAKCNDAACSGGNETITFVDTANSVGEYTSIAIGTDGLPVISYFDNTTNALKVVKCFKPDCN